MLTLNHKHKDIYGKVVSEITMCSEEADLSEVMDDIKRFLIAVGFHPESVSKYIPEE